jgi:hypothetical protein
MASPLPPVVCVFDDTIVHMDNPLVLHRYALLTCHLDERLQCIEFGPHALEASELILQQHAPRVCPSEAGMAMIVRSNGVARSTKLWFTGEHVSIGDLSNVPVIDLDARQIIHDMNQFRHKIAGDDLVACRLRQSAQRNIRIEHVRSFFPRPSPLVIPPVVGPVFEVRERVPTPFPEEQEIALELAVPQPQPQQQDRIPKFVAEIIKRDAIASGQSCPISMNAFTTELACKLTNCYHLFEEAALETWLEVKNQCPMCKKRIEYCIAV